MKVYRIKDWSMHFENSKSREREKCSFCCVPNKQDGLGYGMLLRQPNGEALYGAFVAVVLVCSKQKNRQGWLTADGLPAGCPLSARQLSVKCQFSEKTIQDMLSVVSSQEVGWIEVLESENNTISSEIIESARRVPAECPPSALERKKEEKERREGKEGSIVSAPPPLQPKFQKPEFSEMELYAAKIGLPALEINKFENHYEANGWKVGRNPMKDWQAAMRNWKLNYQTYAIQTNRGANSQGVNRNAGTYNEHHQSNPGSKVR